jgi:GTPase SAR1 family protein
MELQRVCEGCYHNLSLLECVKNDIFQMKIVALGDTGIGKTSLLQKYVNNEYQERAQPTMG